MSLHIVHWMIRSITLIAVCMTVLPSWAQRVRFPSVSNRTTADSNTAPPTAVTLQPPVSTPFDPYAVGSANYGTTPAVSPGVTAPTLPPPTWTAPTTGAPASGSLIQTPPPVIQVPPFSPGQPTAVPAQPPNAAGQLPVPAGPPGVANPNIAPALTGPAYPPAAPNAVFPNGLMPGWAGGWFAGTNALEPPPYQSLFEDFYGRYTWLHGDSGPGGLSDELEIQEIELATSLVIPGSWGIAEEFRVTPGFIYDALGGPFTPPAFSLPENLYSVYLDAYTLAQLTPQLSGEVNARMGFYSNFDSWNTDVIRLTGRGTLMLKLTPTMTIKGGVEYIDRNDLKLLPAGGVLWEPSPKTRFDISFPRPKLAKYFTTLGANEVWWYVGAEYGGGAWYVRDMGGNPYTGPIDINDYRAFAGLDFTRPSGLTGFVEGGYVFEREIFYVAVQNVFPLEDTFMLRAGLIW